MKFFKFTLPVLTLFALASCDFIGKKGAQICDESLSLRTECVTVMAKALPAAQYGKQDPGSSQKIPRPYVIYPPNIPHQIEGLMITKEDNPCMMCHGGMMEGMPPVPTSHKREAKIIIQRSAKPQVTRVAGYQASSGNLDQGRYVCTTCHVPQATNLKPLVKNLF